MNTRRLRSGKDFGSLEDAKPSTTTPRRKLNDEVHNTELSSTGCAAKLTVNNQKSAHQSPAQKSRKLTRKNDCLVEEKMLGSKDLHVAPLKGREKEFASMQQWINTAIEQQNSLSIYISGSPGTGKTATTRLLLDSFGSTIQPIIINCVSIKTQSELILSIFKNADEPFEHRPTVAGLKLFLEELGKPLVLVLDEIDHLSTSTNSVLYNAFQWPHSLSPMLILVGIANSIDLTERLLPKLRLARPPESLVFAPYTKDNIVAILTDKMEVDDQVKVDRNAVELCARKVAAMTGDLRTALHVFKQTKSASAGASSGCREVLSVLNSVYSSPVSRARLPLQARLLLAVCLTLSKNKKKSLTRSSLFDAYLKACDLVKVPPLESDDLSAAFQTLESQSFVSVSNNGQIRLQVDTSTARSAISDNVMIDQIANMLI